MYTSEFENKYISLEILLQVYLSLRINTYILKIYFKYSSESKNKYIN